MKCCSLIDLSRLLTCFVLVIFLSSCRPSILDYQSLNIGPGYSIDIQEQPRQSDDYGNELVISISNGQKVLLDKSYFGNKTFCDKNIKFQAGTLLNKYIVLYAEKCPGQVLLAIDTTNNRIWFQSSSHKTMYIKADIESIADRNFILTDLNYLQAFKALELSTD